MTEPLTAALICYRLAAAHAQLHGPTGACHRAAILRHIDGLLDAYPAVRETQRLEAAWTHPSPHPDPSTEIDTS